MLGVIGYYLISYLYPGDPHANFKIDHSIKWEQFINDCGKKVNYDQAKKTYHLKYQGNYVEWEGHVMRVDGNENNLLHQAKILMVMNPRDMHSEQASYGDREPDLLLSFDIYSFNRNKLIIEDLKRGDYIRFNATITHLALRRYQSATYT